MDGGIRVFGILGFCGSICFGLVSDWLMCLKDWWEKRSGWCNWIYYEEVWFRNFVIFCVGDFFFVLGLWFLLIFFFWFWFFEIVIWFWVLWYDFLNSCIGLFFMDFSIDYLGKWVVDWRWLLGLLGYNFFLWMVVSEKFKELGFFCSIYLIKVSCVEKSKEE